MAQGRLNQKTGDAPIKRQGDTHRRTQNTNPHARAKWGQDSGPQDTNR